MRASAFALAILVFVAITTPYIYAEHVAGDDLVFGGFLHNPIDGNSYLAKMYEGWRGEWVFTLPYTAEQSRGAYLFLFYIFLGHLARWVGLPLIWIFHLARLVSAVVLSWALMRFLAKLYPESNYHGWAFAVSIAGAGLGWLAAPFGVYTSDLLVSEAYPFLSMFVNPHFTIGLALLLWLLTIPQNDDRPLWRVGLTAWLASVTLAIIAPFGIVLAFIVLSALLVWEFWHLRIQRRGICTGSYFQHLAVQWVGVMSGGVPILIYDYGITYKDKLLAGWNAQNLTLSPPVWDIILSMCPVMLLALLGIKSALRRGSAGDRLALVWSGLGFVLLYLPFGLQRRFMMGLFIPVVALACVGLEGLARNSIKRANLMATLVLLFSLPTNLMILLAAGHGIQTHDLSIYLTRGESRALEWIQSNTPEDALILASPEISLFIPARTGRRVLYGHPFETVNAEVEKSLVLQFFKGYDDWAETYLAEKGVNYIFLGRREIELGGQPYNLPVVYSGESVLLYQVIGH